MFIFYAIIVVLGSMAGDLEANSTVFLFNLAAALLLTYIFCCFPII
jgi:hypothetical protein